MMERAAREIAIKYGVSDVDEIMSILDKYDLEQELDHTYFKTEIEHLTAINDDLKQKMADYAAIAQHADRLANTIEAYQKSPTPRNYELVENEIRAYRKLGDLRKKKAS